MKEYETGLTPEAMLVKDLDKFEMILQAYEYEKGKTELLKYVVILPACQSTCHVFIPAENRPGECQEFFDSTAGQMILPSNMAVIDHCH